MYDIKKLGKGKSINIKANFDVSVPEVFGTQEDVFVEFEGRLIHGGHNFLLEGVADAVVAAPCNRCLKICEMPINFNLAENFVQEGVVSQPDVEDIVFSDDTVNILPAIERNLYTFIPMKFVCHEECLGLCSKCGVNLNLEKCDCKAVIREEFAALADMFK